MLFIDMLDLFVRPFIDDRVQTVDNAESDKRHADDEKDVSDRIGRLSERIGQKIEADDAQNHTARKTQKQTDDLLGIAREQHAEQSAQPRPRHACAVMTITKTKGSIFSPVPWWHDLRPPYQSSLNLH